MFPYCHSLNENGRIGSQGLVLLGVVAWLHRYGLVGGSVSLWVGFEVSAAQTRPSVPQSLLIAFRSGIEFSVTSPAPSMAVCHHACSHDDNKLNL